MQSLLLLHGAIGAADQLQPLAEVLKKTYDVHVLDFSGHGGREMVSDSFSIQLFAKEVLGYMNDKGLQQVSIFGYSMGGYVALYLAQQAPDRVNKIVTLATKFHWDEATAAKESQMLNAEKIEAKLPAFAEALTQRHAPNDWKQLLQHTIDMLVHMGKDNPLKPEDYTAIHTPVRILLGDRDKMVTLEETVAVYKWLPDAQMGMLPATPHPIEQVNMDVLSFFISEYLG